jgi:hypothetical protein
VLQRDAWPFTSHTIAVDRARALAFLLDRAEESRARLAAGGRLGPQRVLGPLGAPYWLLLPRVPAAPAAPWRGLRAYSSCWLPAERLAGAVPERRRIAEHLR